MNKILVVYYSYEGHTKRVAKLIQKHYDCVLLAIKPKKEMTSKGFGKYFWGGAQVYMRKIPKLEPFDVNFDLYDTIFIGTPIWAWTITPPVKSFLMEHLFTGKNVYVFYTHEGGPGKVENVVKKLLNDNDLVGSKGFLNAKGSEDQTESDVSHWLKEIEENR